MVFQVRDEQVFFCADNDLFNSAVAVDQQTDLTMQFQRKFNQAGGQLNRATLICRNATSEESFDCL